MKILAITQARIGSSRLPAKVLKEIQGTSLLDMHLQRLLRSERISQVVVATTLEPSSEKICEIAAGRGLAYYQGSLQDVLDRFYQAALPYQPDYVVRVTADCPLLDATVVDQVIDVAVSQQLDYASNGMERTFPDGEDVEVFTFAALEKAWKEATLPSDREHVTPYIWRNSSFKGGSLFRSENIFCNKPLGDFRLTVDEPADFEVIAELVNELGFQSDWQEYVLYLQTHPEIRAINGHISCNEGYQKSLNNDALDNH
jgi:spore coat polysaccharide biosynthesis protein SpsF (cytidylyltransferase family)